MFFDDEIDRFFRKSPSSFFNLGGLFEEARHADDDSLCYGYTITVGSDGKPAVREYGNIKPQQLASQNRQPLVDTIVDKQAKSVKLVAEMPGVEKNDVKIIVDGQTVSIAAERGEKKYQARVPLKQPIREDSARASYKNGILELVFDLAEPEKPKGKTVEVK